LDAGESLDPGCRRQALLSWGAVAKARAKR
jgi:hypothetical protein